MYMYMGYIGLQRYGMVTSVTSKLLCLHLSQANIYIYIQTYLLKQCYLQVKVYLCLVEAPDCFVIIMSSWQISF